MPSTAGRLRRGSAAGTLTVASRTLILRATLRSGPATKKVRIRRSPVGRAGVVNDLTLRGPQDARGATRLPDTHETYVAIEASMDNPYLEVISYLERVHRQFLEVVKLELEGLRIRDINNVQAMMLFNIGDAEMTVGELTLRGCYLGSNV